jgi:hypothetical protein
LVFAAAAGLVGLTTGFAALFLGAGFGVFFFAAMAQRSRIQVVENRLA